MKKKHIIATVGALTVGTTAAVAVLFANGIKKKMLPYDNQYSFTGDKKVFEGAFESDSYAVSFGGLALDFREATLKDNLGTLRLFGHFSGIDIVVPDEWVVKTIGVFRNSGVNNQADEETNENQPTLIVKHDLLYSGLNIRRASFSKEITEDAEEETEKMMAEAQGFVENAK
jgi:hypothetical protein